MKQDDLNKILEQHELWLGGYGGAKADLSNADLSKASLSWADLRWANLPEKTVVTYGEHYFIQIYKDNVRAGCECHSAEEWRNFDEEKIGRMGGKKAVDFYPRLLEIIDFYCGKEDE